MEVVLGLPYRLVNVRPLFDYTLSFYHTFKIYAMVELEKSGEKMILMFDFIRLAKIVLVYFGVLCIVGHEIQLQPKKLQNDPYD